MSYPAASTAAATQQAPTGSSVCGVRSRLVLTTRTRMPTAIVGERGPRVGPPPDDLPLAGNEVHIWAAALDVDAAALAKFAGALSVAEKERAAKFKFERLRDRFIAGRGSLRAILGRYLRVEPAVVDFIYSPQGKPSLAPEFSSARIHFSLAHSEDLALVAATRAGPVGVDVERIRPLKDAADLVSRFFSARESELFQKLAADRKPEAFFNLWTRKEALLKATGEGLAGGLNRVEVTFLESQPPSVLAISGDFATAARWKLSGFSPAAGFVGAVAIQADNVRLRCWTA